MALTEGDLIGKTASEIRALCHARDVADLLRIDGGDDEQRFLT